MQAILRPERKNAFWYGYVDRLITAKHTVLPRFFTVPHRLRTYLRTMQAFG